MISTNQEETYSLKAAFERCSAIFEVKINRYNADNEIFAEQLSISEHLSKASFNEAFERCSAIFEVKINSTGTVPVNRYNADNEIFAEQLSISEIEDFNQTITFFWVGYNRQNAMVEIQIKTITLGARTFILHAIR